jgi:voltage-gated potassium channel
MKRLMSASLDGPRVKSHHPSRTMRGRPAGAEDAASVKRPRHHLLDNTITARRAGQWIAIVTILVGLAGAIAIRVLDPHDFPTIGSGLWWSIQTITTVGYGDHVPTSGRGQIVGAVIMVTGIGFITVVSASITAAFVESARRKLGRANDQAVLERLERIEKQLDELLK